MKYLGIMLLFLSSYVMAEEVYYCSDNHNGSNGYWKNKQTGQYEPSSFRESKFKIKLQDDGNIAIDNPNSGRKDLYLCSTPYQGRYNMGKYKSCVEEGNIGIYFNFNQDNGRYIRFKGFGYVFDNNDTVVTDIGTCTKS